MLSLRDTDLQVNQLPRTNNSVFNLPLKISWVADVITCSDSPFHTMGAEKQKADWADYMMFVVSVPYNNLCNFSSLYNVPGSFSGIL